MNFVFDPSLVLYLPLHEMDGDSFMSKDARGHQCTVTGAIWQSEGRYFDGNDDKIVVAHHSALNFERTDRLSICLWLNIADDSSTQLILGKYDINYRGYAINFRTTTNLIEFELINGVSPENWIQVRGSTVLTASQWYHVTITYDGSSAASGISIYVDSAVETPEVKKDSLSATVQNTDGLYLGENLNGGGDVTGYIGEVLIYSRALTPQEIQQNYLATKGRYQ